MNRLKHIFSLTVIAFSLFACGGYAFSQGNAFTDVDADSKYAEAIYSLYEKGIVDGFLTKDNKYEFKSDDTISRAETAKLISLFISPDGEEFLNTTSEFSDVSKEHWANKYIAYAAKMGGISGYKDKTFRPENPVTYGEVVKILVSVKGYGEVYKKTSPWYEGYTEIAKELGITENTDCDGKKNATRGAVAQLIYNTGLLKELPKMYFEGDISEMTDKKDIRNISVKYEDGDKSFNRFATLKVQGTSSLAYDKKNYTINFYKDDTYTEKMPVDAGWGEESEYCLKANWIDKTHSRNIVTARIASDVQEKYGLLEDAPNNGLIDGFPIEVYSNGKFLGIYTFNIPKDEWLFNMDSENSDHIVVCGEMWGDETLFKAMPNFTMWELEVGEESDENLAKLERMVDFVINSTDEVFRSDFNNYLDLDSVLNYYVISDVAYLCDNLGKNMLLLTYDGEKWYTGLYDLDTSWGTHWTGKDLFGYEADLVNMSWSNLFGRMEANFSKELSERYFELREGILSKENIMSEFTAFKNEIPDGSLLKEECKWGKDIPGYDISQIESYLDSVLPRLDEKYTKWAKVD